MRTQLTRAELFFIHYNALTGIGAPSRDPISRYRITKHLYIFDFLEFKYITAKFKGNVNEKREGLNLCFYYITEKIKRILKGMEGPDDRGRYRMNFSNRFDFTILRPCENKLTLEFTEYKESKNRMPELKGLADLDIDNRLWLLKNYLRLIFIESSFNLINPGDVTFVTGSKLIREPNPGKRYVTIKAHITRTDGEPLRLLHPDPSGQKKEGR